jgi:hypothetical protein
VGGGFFYHHAVIGVCANRGMSEDKLVRVTNLRLIMRAKQIKGPSALGRAIFRKPNYTGPLIAGKNSFGEGIARHIEACFGLPRGWMDYDHGGEPITFGDPRPHEMDMGDETPDILVAEMSPPTVHNQPAQPIQKARDEILAATRTDNIPVFSPMATRLAKAFDELPTIDAQIEAFAACIAEISKVSESIKKD